MKQELQTYLQPVNSKSMSPKFAVIAYVLFLLWLSNLGSAVSQTPAPTASPNPNSLSPDKKWEYNKDDDQPKIVKAGTNEVALELDGSGGLDWAPDSKRFACYSGGGGRSHTTFLYQVRGDEWKELKEPIDAVYEILNKAIAVQVQEKGVTQEDRPQVDLGDRGGGSMGRFQHSDSLCRSERRSSGEFGRRLRR